MDIWIIEEVITSYTAVEEPVETRRYLDYGYFTTEAEAVEIVHMLHGMSGYDGPNDHYDPTGCSYRDTFETVGFDAVKVSPAPEDLVL